MKFTEFHREHVAEAAALFVENYRRQRQVVPVLPGLMTETAQVAEDKAAIYLALYRAAAAQWTAAGCQVHAITLLAQDGEAEKVWFWQGFGLAVVDAVRAVRPLDTPPSTPLHIRQATVVDAPALTALDAEHWQHYSQPPILMTPRSGLDADGNAANGRPQSC